MQKHNPTPGILPLLGCLAACLGLGAAPALAQADPEPLVTDRPDFTESAVTVAPGRWQLETGLTFEQADDEVEILTVGEVLARIGLSPLWELRIGVDPYVDVEVPGGGASGIGDSFLGAKLRLTPGLLGDGGGTEAALLFGTSLPTGDDELGEDELQPEAILALGWELAPRWSLGANAGYTAARAGGERFDQFSASLAAGYSVDDALGLYAEWFGFSKEAPGGSEVHVVNAGATYLLSPDLQLDFRVGTGIDDGPDWFVGAGVSARF